MFLDDSMLGPQLGQSTILPPHQHLAASGKQRELLDIPSKKLKNLDETSAYQLEYQRYQAFIYAHCAQQQRIGQMSAFRPWAPPKSFLQVPYNSVATLPYLSQEPPVLQNPERVVRNTDRERFERTYQPNVALAPRKSILTKEREKEQRERDRERDRERERERELREREQRDHERELERVREKERERSLELERERDLQQQKLQQQQHVAITNLCEAELHIKQERANTPADGPQSPPPADEELLDRRSNGPMEDETTMPMTSPLSLSISQQHHQQPQQHPNQQQQQHLHKSSHIEMLQLQPRRHSLHTSNSASSTSSTTSSLSTHSGLGCDREHVLLSSTSPHQQQQSLPGHLPPPNLAHHRLPQQLPLHQPHLRQQQQQQSPPSPPPTQSPEQFSNEISSSTSPLPTNQQHARQQQQSQHQLSSNSNLHHQQTIIATVNQHAKLLPISSTASASLTASSNSNSISISISNNNDMPSRIRISKNLINQPNIMRSPTPPPTHPHNQLPHRQQLLQHQQQYEHYKQQQQQQRLYQQQQQSPSQSSSANMSSNSTSLDARTAGLNLSTNLSSNGGVVIVAKNQLQHPQQQQLLQQNGGNHMGSEFELSTDTDDDSLNGEPDSSNMLAPWELAVEALKDTRPKDRERILQLLQKILQDNQQYRYDNLQLTEELRKRDKQICDLQEQLCRRHQMAAAATTTNQNGGCNVLAKIDSCQNTEVYAQGMLSLPLKKSTRRESNADMESQQNQQKEQQINCNGAVSLQEQEISNERHDKRALRDAEDTESDEDVDEDVEEEKDGVNAEEETDKERQQGRTRNAKRQSDSDNDEDEEEEQQQDVEDDDEDEDEEENRHQRRDDDGNSRMSDSDMSTVQAPHTNAVGTPPTATTPRSPDSAATAGQLFDSSNSSDEASMKKAQMSASNALAKMANRGEADYDDNEDEDDEEDDNEGVEDQKRLRINSIKVTKTTTPTPTTDTGTPTTTNHEMQIKQELI